MIIQKITFKNHYSINKSCKFPQIESFERVILTDFKTDSGKVKTATLEHANCKHMNI